MTKRLVDVDDDLLTAAQAAAGEATIKATVHRALELMVTKSRGQEQQLAERWAALGEKLADLHDEDVMRRAWS